MKTPELPKYFEFTVVEATCRQLWADHHLHQFNPNSDKPVYSIDTPPPYASAAHLHVGHAMSYSQAEFIVRYKRMQGFEIFYPMGFDDNGLPTERYVEQKHQVDKKSISRKDFRQLCLDETARCRGVYQDLWNQLGLSIDWRLNYSTINDHCTRTAQASFLDLYHKNAIYRSEEPVLWDTSFETSLAQADVETITRKAKLHDIAFLSSTNDELVISTTRPEMLPACVALFYHPEDSRYQHLAGQNASVPLFNHEVPMLTSEEVVTEFGTGLMMVCTFGDGEDVKKWKEHKLNLRLCLTPDGKLNELAGNYAGQTCEQARAKILKDLDELGALKQSHSIKQATSVSERSQLPVEFQITKQWFIRILDKKEALLARSKQLQWFPEFMKVRLDQWIEGLKYDWNISRQRFYGVPFPVWYCTKCAHAVVAKIEQLPVDPSNTPCPEKACPECGHDAFRPELDVMDTWMTSSLTPLINTNWANSPDQIGTHQLYPMSLRVQAFEIIRTWLFYTVLKSDIHTDTLPWETVMISGWGLNEQGKKISKRELEKFTDESGFNRYDPKSIMEKYGADALRYWAAGSHLGNDLRFHEKDVKAGQKLVIKLWNAARFCLMQLDNFDPHADRPDFLDRTPEDRWLLIELNQTVERVTQGFEAYNYAIGRDALDRFFWLTFCDNYLEMVKDRFWHPERHSESSRLSAMATLFESLRILLGLFAPYIPYITETLYQQIYQPFEQQVSLHISQWPTVHDGLKSKTVPEMDLVLALLLATRSWRTQHNLPQTKQLRELIIDTSKTSEATKAQIETMKPSILSVARVETLSFGAGELACEFDQLQITLT